MKLYIRSQNKLDLVPIYDTISILEDEWIDGLENQYQKYNLTYNEKKLGVYNSLEKALEVLDEIQQAAVGIISEKDIVDTNSKEYTGLATMNTEEKVVIYEMPEN